MVECLVEFEALVEEIALIESDYVRAYYFEVAFDMDGLKENEVEKLLEHTGQASHLTRYRFPPSPFLGT